MSCRINGPHIPDFHQPRFIQKDNGIPSLSGSGRGYPFEKLRPRISVFAVGEVSSKSYPGNLRNVSNGSKASPMVAYYKI